ncbi:hypothetical protein TL16_g09119 [Triparma laevis f. inornata]|uniref:Uncharacterized protein n=1 Tax=Triparma laevis f. inornata TaxID=1714386 RepID=A0A9W7B047_9STRA|nr:hypothetical protein TL16_g09119 [Triparma laevis f. inornata]
MLHKLNLFMVPKEVGEVEKEDFKMEDWERDCWRGGVMGGRLGRGLLRIEGSLDDLSSLFSGKFDFRTITPYSSNRLLSCILDIYESRIISIKSSKEKHKHCLIKSFSQHIMLVNAELPTLQEFIVEWFKVIYSSRGEVLLGEVKAFIVGCFYHDHPRIKMFKYFFSKSTVEDSDLQKESKPDRTSASNHAMNLISRVFPDLQLRLSFLKHTAVHSSVFVNKSDFMDAFHHSVPHVPKMAASYQQFLFELGSMLNYKHPDTGEFCPAGSFAGKAIYVKNKACQNAVQQSYETSMKNLNTPHSHRDKFNALTEYVSFEDAMNLCLRVWDLEDDYLQCSKVQSALRLLQYWFRKHKRLQRRRRQTESSPRVAGQLQADLEALKLKTTEHRSSSVGQMSFLLEGDNEDMDLEIEAQPSCVTPPKNVSLTPKRGKENGKENGGPGVGATRLGGSFGWANQPTPTPTPRASTTGKSGITTKATKKAGIAAQVQSQNESPSKAERDAAIKKGIYTPRFLKKNNRPNISNSNSPKNKKEDNSNSAYLSFNGSQVVPVPSPTHSTNRNSPNMMPTINNFFSGISATEEELERRETAVKFQQSQVQMQRQEDFIMEAEREASTMLAMEREAREMEEERVQKQNVIAMELKNKQKKERAKQFAANKRTSKGAVRGNKLSLKVGGDGGFSSKKTVSFGVGGSSVHFEPDFPTTNKRHETAKEKTSNSNSDVYGLMFEAPGLREMPERIGISSAQGQRPESMGGSRGSQQNHHGSRHTQHNATDDGNNWAATNKAPGRPATAGTVGSNGARWSQIDADSFLAMRPNTVNTNKSPRQRRQQQQQQIQKHRHQKQKHHHHKHKHKYQARIDKADDPAKTLSMQVTANKLYNPVQMAGYY